MSSAAISTTAGTATIEILLTLPTTTPVAAPMTDNDGLEIEDNAGNAITENAT